MKKNSPRALSLFLAGLFTVLFAGFICLISLADEKQEGIKKLKEQEKYQRDFLGNISLEFRQKYAHSIQVYADQQRIFEAIRHLVVNAIGIEPDVLPRNFERFFRIDKSRSRQEGGTGLGLSIVKHIIEAYKQAILVNSKPGKGTTFTFTLAKGIGKK